jgi:hypothetical protein
MIIVLYCFILPYIVLYYSFRIPETAPSFVVVDEVRLWRFRACFVVIVDMRHACRLIPQTVFVPGNS